MGALAHFLGPGEHPAREPGRPPEDQHRRRLESRLGAVRGTGINPAKLFLLDFWLQYFLLNYGTNNKKWIHFEERMCLVYTVKTNN